MPKSLINKKSLVTGILIMVLGTIAVGTVLWIKGKFVEYADLKKTVRGLEYRIIRIEKKMR